MAAETWSDQRAQALTERVVEAAAVVLRDGGTLTFKEVAAASGVPERTLYRHFPTRADLLTTLFEETNNQIGFAGERPTDLTGATALVRAAFPRFDEQAPIVRELLASPEGRAVTLADKDERRAAALALVRNHAPDLSPAESRRVAAVAQLLTSAAAWQSLRDQWDLDGEEGAEAAAFALELLLNAAGTAGTTPRGGTP
jgi:AcrR family transcriptional regulator